MLFRSGRDGAIAELDDASGNTRIAAVIANDLIEAIYKAYPHMAAKSVFRRLTEDTH